LHLLLCATAPGKLAVSAPDEIGGIVRLWARSPGGGRHDLSRKGAAMRMNAKLLLLAPALLLAACAQPMADGTRPIAQAGAAPSGPIKLTVGGYYSAAAGVTVGGH
jgi:hypothetical protein